MEVVPNVTYQFQAVAWEEIGIIGRVDCNKSPSVHQGPNRARLQVSARTVQYLQSLGLAKREDWGDDEQGQKLETRMVWCFPKSCHCHSIFLIIAVYGFERMYKCSNIVQTFFQQTNRVFNGIARISLQYDVKVGKNLKGRVFLLFLDISSPKIRFEIIKFYLLVFTCGHRPAGLRDPGCCWVGK